MSSKPFLWTWRAYHGLCICSVLGFTPTLASKGQGQSSNMHLSDNNLYNQRISDRILVALWWSETVCGFMRTFICARLFFFNPIQSHYLVLQ